MQKNANLVDLEKNLMLQNAPFLDIKGLDTAENEPSKVSMKWGSQTGVAPVIGAHPRAQPGPRRGALDQ